MIFNMNTNYSNNIPMAEGYDGSIGCAKALVESARNDYAMFRAMLESDARELSLRSNGYVNESEVYALSEATVGGIWSKIKELIQKLIAKIKSIFANFLAKFKSLYASDKKLIKDYGTKVIRKRLDKMEIKWRKPNGGKASALDYITKKMSNVDEIVNTNLEAVAYSWDDDIDKRWKIVTKKLEEKTGFQKIESSDASELRDNIEDAIWEDESISDYDFEDIFSSGRELVTLYESLDKLNKDSQKIVNKITKKLDSELKEINKFADQAAKDAKDYDDEKGFKGKSNYFDKKDNSINIGKNVNDMDGSLKDIDSKGDNTKRSYINNMKTNPLDSHGDSYNSKSAKELMDTRSKFANQTYDMCNIMNDALLICCNAYISAQKDFYKQTKAVFMKAVTVNDKKLEESSIYAQAVAEAAIYEIDTIF